MYWKGIVLFTLLTLMARGDTPTAALDKPAKAPERESERQAIDKLNEDMLRAFEKRDAAAMAAHWAEGGEFIHNDGEPIRGRAAIQKGYEEFFKTIKGKPKVEVRSDAVRFPSADVALTETTLWLKNDGGEVVASARQNAVLVREGGQWKLAVVREWDRDATRDASLKDLEWLVGTWRAATKEREVTITYEWDDGKAFIRGKFAVKEGGKIVESGTELIGKDNAEGVIRSWVFQSDGGFGGGTWAREGKKWSVEAHGVTAEGKKLTGTTLYIPLDPGTVTWQAVHQTVDGVAVADTPPIKVTKQKPAK